MKKILLIFNNLLMTITLLFSVISCNISNKQKQYKIQLIDGIKNDITATNANANTIFVGTNDGKIYQKNKNESSFSEFSSQLENNKWPINNLLVNENHLFVSTVTDNMHIDGGGRLYKYDFNSSNSDQKVFSHFHDFDGKTYSLFFSESQKEIYINIELEATVFHFYKAIIANQNDDDDTFIDNHNFKSTSAVLKNNYIYVTDKNNIHRFTWETKKYQKLTINGLDPNVQLQFKNLIIDKNNIYVIGEQKDNDGKMIIKNIIFKSNDGITFERTPIEVNWEIKTMIANNGNIYFGGNNSYFYTATKKNNFSNYNKVIENDFTEINTLLYKENTIYLGSNGGKFYLIK